MTVLSLRFTSNQENQKGRPAATTLPAATSSSATWPSDFSTPLLPPNAPATTKTLTTLLLQKPTNTTAGLSPRETYFLQDQRGQPATPIPPASTAVAAIVAATAAMEHVSSDPAPRRVGNPVLCVPHECQTGGA